MKKKTKLYAQYEDHNFGHKGQGVEVADFEQAVQLGLHVGSPRFKTFEISSVDIDGEVLEGKPKNHSANIYLSVSRVYTRDEVIEHYRKKRDSLLRDRIVDDVPQNIQDQFCMAMKRDAAVVESVIEAFLLRDEKTCFILEGGQRGDFIELNDGEMVFDRQGQQLFPAREQDPVLEAAPEL